jgi:DNA-binding transcriptional LysR family regulator
MAITLRQVKYFVATAELGQVSQAAAQLAISQSAVTTAIRELEAILGVRLFLRSAQGMELTEHGRSFLERSYTLLAAVDDAMRLPKGDSKVSGTLSVAATYTVIGYFLPYHLARLAQLYPDLTINLYELNREAIEEGIISNRYDLALVLTSNLINPELAAETFFSSQRRLWVSANHPLSKVPSVTLDHVAREPYIMLTVDEAAHTALRYWVPTGLQPTIRLRTSSVEAVRSMVANGTGVAILSDMVYRPWSLEGKRIETVVMKDPIPPMNVGLAWKNGNEFTPQMSLLRKYFRQVFIEPHSNAPARR